MSTATVAILITALAVLVLLWLLRLISHRMLYKPLKLRHAPQPQFESHVAFEHAWFTTGDNVRLHGWHCTNPANQATLLICHGNKGSIEGREDTVHFYMALGLDVFIFDYRGYGLSEGHPTERGTYRDVDAAWHYLTENLRLPPERLVVLGRSLGAAIAAHLAQSARPAAVILESTFASLPKLSRELYPWSHLLFSLNIRYDTVKKISAFRSPLLLVHSEDDELIGMQHARELLAAAPEGTDLVVIGGRHRDGFFTSKERYIPAIKKFLHECHVPLNTLS